MQNHSERAGNRASESGPAYGRLTPEQAVRAKNARRRGIWDDPDLKRIGPLKTDTQADIDYIDSLVDEPEMSGTRQVEP